jgi:hypothetical protein
MAVIDNLLQYQVYQVSQLIEFIEDYLFILLDSMK